MSIELWCLYGAAVLALVHLTAASFSFKTQVTTAYSVGPRDEGIQPKGVAGRLERAQRNFLETFSAFIAAVLMLTHLQGEGRLSEVGALLYLVGRIAFLPLYASGVAWLRTFSWNFATLGLVLVLAQVAVVALR